MSRPARSSSAPPAASRALRRQNHLQHLVRVFKKFPELVALRAQRLRRQLRRHFDSCHRRVFRHVANFIHLDASVSAQRCLQLLCQRGRLRVSAWKRAHKSRKLRLRQPRRKVNARDPRRSQQLRKASFSRRRAHRHAVEQNLVSRSAQQHAASGTVLQRLPQLLPRRIKLRGRLGVAKLVQPRKLQQNVQAANKRPRSALYFRTHAPLDVLQFRSYPLNVSTFPRFRALTLNPNPECLLTAH